SYHLRPGGSALALPVGREGRQLAVADELGRDHGDAARSQRTERRRADAALERGPLAEHRPRPHLGDLLAAHLDPEHAVEQEVEIVSLRALLNEHLALLELSPGELRIAGEQRTRQVTLECALRRRDECRGVSVAPRCVVAVRLAVPRPE